MSDLSGVGVMVTRPAPLAHKLVDELSEKGAEVCWYPSLEITPVSHQSPDVSPDWLILTSPAAAVHAPVQFLQVADRIVVMGKGTRAALPEKYHEKVLCPAPGTRSETLFSALGIQDMAAKNILIIKGVGGRGLLRNDCIERGATVQTLDVYQRTCPDKSLLPEFSRFAHLVDVVTVTSIDCFRHLMHLLGPKGCAWLSTRTILVSSPRQRDFLEHFPCIQHTIMARSAHTDDLVSAIAQWRNQD